MQAEKEQKEIEASATLIVEDFMRLHKRHLNALEYASEQTAKEIGDEKQKLFDDIVRRGNNGDKAAQLAIIMIARQ